ncbi:TetR/AcrR family transcriptional regulator [Nitratireductor mangrovi]|uniref:TetR/AcrR family transcriptional regulator n=1 Tax=Nitratireductor mangrovi TaxID=2599600 RepID=A0A5B8L0S8_9HYPH|nr:TetR/AcrR family transcriptional regulator [Nitratireductor mangrovi]QDZ01506.1 TetR/AcrR family transcriptional regulator [Nitratireductor mangrovi]
MPYAKDHKARSRQRILEAARILFNRHGYDRVTIDQVMAKAGLTRGGFYAHFSCKEDLFADAMASFINGRGAEWRSEEGIDPRARQLLMAKRMVAAYLSRRHLDDRDGHCPLIAYATDVSRAGERVRDSYRAMLEAMTSIFENNLDGEQNDRRQRALALTALCVGGMILARTLPETPIADEVRQAALTAANGMWRTQQENPA